MEFERAVNFVLKEEGGYVDDEFDTGGETNFGISKKSFPNVDIKNLTIGMAKHLYEVHYWIPMKGDGLPRNIRLIAFDCAVNQGVSFASKSLQEASNAKVDGVIGPKTLEALYQTDEKELLEKFTQKRMERYFNIPTFKRYGKGWIKRLIRATIETSV